VSVWNLLTCDAVHFGI